MHRTLLLAALLAIHVGNPHAHAAEPQSAPNYPDHRDLTYYLRHDGTRAEIRTVEDWRERRRHIRAGIEEAMGPLPNPDKPVPLDVRVVEEHRADGLIRRKLEYHTDQPNQRVRAWLLLPLPPGEGRGEGSPPNPPLPKREPQSERPEKLPAILCLHQTTRNGKDSPVGLSDRPTLHYAIELARRGYVTLSPDYPSFGEYPYDFDADDYHSGSMKAIYDNIRAIDVLAAMPEVDAKRIACIGHSLGGHNALFTAVFDERLQAVVTSCGFTSFHKYKGGDLTGWSGPRYMPRVASRYHVDPDQVPFDFPEILAAIAPRTVFVVAPLHDDNFDVSGVRDCVTAARPIYKLLAHPNRLQAAYPDATHDFPDAQRTAAYEFLDRNL